MCTLLNNSGTVLYPGDMLEWCFYNQKAYSSAGSKGAARGNSNPRRITVKIATTASERVIGRALSFAKPGETFDLVSGPRRSIKPHPSPPCHCINSPLLSLGSCSRAARASIAVAACGYFGEGTLRGERVRCVCVSTQPVYKN